MALILVSGIVASAQKHPSKCGNWRWDVKTLTDPDGLGLLTKVPTVSTIDELVAVIPPKILHAGNKTDGVVPRFTNEKMVVEIIAFVTVVKRATDDSDLHFILKPETSYLTIVGEIPDPNCATFDKYPQIKGQFTTATQDGKAIWNVLKQTKKPVKVKVAGISFWDGIYDTRPKGVSQYSREIHPIIKIEKL